MKPAPTQATNNNPNPAAITTSSSASTTTNLTMQTTQDKPKPRPLTANDLREAYEMYLEQSRGVRGTAGRRIGEEKKVGLFGGWA